VIVVGDGITDYEIKERHGASTFFAFVENAARPPVMEKADRVIGSFDELLYHYGLPPRSSIPMAAEGAAARENPSARRGVFCAAWMPAENRPRGAFRGGAHRRNVGRRDSRHPLRHPLYKACARCRAPPPRVGAFCIGTTRRLRTQLKKGIRSSNAPYANGEASASLRWV